VLHIIPGKQYLIGAVVISKELFVILSENDDQIQVYDVDSFAPARQIALPDIKNAHSLTGCQSNLCLYVGDIGHKSIQLVDLKTSSITQWKTGEPPRGLSVTRSHNLLVTVELSTKVQEYTTTGNLVREIKLDVSLDCPQHCVELPSGQFVVSHLGSTQHRVCIVDASGRISGSYGGPQGSMTEQLRDPRRLAVDSLGNVFVVDCSNDRIEMLSPKLVHLGYLSVAGLQLNRPYTLHVDESSGRLYIGEWVGRVIVSLLSSECLAMLSSQASNKVVNSS